MTNPAGSVCAAAAIIAGAPLEIEVVPSEATVPAGATVGAANQTAPMTVRMTKSAPNQIHLVLFALGGTWVSCAGAGPAASSSVIVSAP